MTHPFSIYIYLALKKKSKADHPINREEIRQYILETFKVDVSVKTITDNIKAIDKNCKQFISVQHVGNNGYYLENNGSKFTLGQVQYLMDAVFSSPDISSEDAVQMNNNLLDLLNDENVKSLKRVANHVLKPRASSSNNAENIFALQEAIIRNIAKNTNIKFIHPLFPEFRTMSPYYLLNKNGHYYVIGSVLVPLTNSIGDIKYEDQLYVFRVDHLEKVKGTTEKRTPIEKVGLSGRNFNLEKYISGRNHIDEGVVVSSARTAVVIYKNPYTSYAIKDLFSSNATIVEKNGFYEATIRSDDKSILEFAFNFANDVEVIKPQQIRSKLIQRANAIVNKYKDVEVQPRNA